jgi:hypothetical protein
MDPTIKFELDLPHRLAIHVRFLSAAQGTTPEQALIDLVQEDLEAWENDRKLSLPRRMR